MSCCTSAACTSRVSVGCALDRGLSSYWMHGCRVSPLVTWTCFDLLDGATNMQQHLQPCCVPRYMALSCKGTLRRHAWRCAGCTLPDATICVGALQPFACMHLLVVELQQGNAAGGRPCRRLQVHCDGAVRCVCPCDVWQMHALAPGRAVCGKGTPANKCHRSSRCCPTMTTSECMSLLLLKWRSRSRT